MAEALLQEMSGHTVEVRSAGSQPKVLHPNAVRVMAERGIDISDRTTKHLRRFTRMHFDRVITLCDRVREVCPEFKGHPAPVHWSMPDPSLEGDTDDVTLPAFERTAKELESRIGFLLPQLIATHEQEETSHV
jgi:protein-tyrosine-phosphatase